MPDLGVLVRQLQGALGGSAIDVGQGTATWTAAINSASVTVPHTLGRVPVYAVASTRNGGVDYAITARTSTSITVVGFATAANTITLTATFDWLVIG